DYQVDARAAWNGEPPPTSENVEIDDAVIQATVLSGGVDRLDRTNADDRTSFEPGHPCVHVVPILRRISILCDDEVLREAQDQERQGAERELGSVRRDSDS